MSFDSIYDFLFNSFTGIWVLIGITFVICIIVCVILEIRQKKYFSSKKENNKNTKED